MKRIKVSLCVAVIVMAAIAGLAAGPDDILGVWNNQEKDAKIEIYRCGQHYCGKVVEIKNPNYPEGSREGVPGTPLLDNNNPDPALRKMPRLGLVVVRDFSYDGANKWVDGKVYDPKNGKTYSGKMTLVSPNQLNLRGYIGISLIGRTAVWTR
jgi:uncharacterized protein (DUF2147 family)